MCIPASVDGRERGTSGYVHMRVCIFVRECLCVCVSARMHVYVLINSKKIIANSESTRTTAACTITTTKATETKNI